MDDCYGYVDDSGTRLQRAKLPVGTKFVVLHSIPHPGLDEVIRRIYETCEYSRPV